MVPRSCGLLITAVVAGGSGGWHRTSNATLTDSYRRCPFMMPMYMEWAKHDSHCRDDAFPMYTGKTGRAPNRSSLEPLEPLAGRTIVFMGDSLTRQHFIATACRLRLDHELLHFAADFKDRESSKGPALLSANATFRASNATFTLRLDNDKKRTHESLLDAGLEAYVAARCEDLRRDDVVVINVGAHYRNTPDTYGERVRSACDRRRRTGGTGGSMRRSGQLGRCRGRARGACPRPRRREHGLKATGQQNLHRNTTAVRALQGATRHRELDPVRAVEDDRRRRRHRHVDTHSDARRARARARPDRQTDCEKLFSS